MRFSAVKLLRIILWKDVSFWPTHIKMWSYWTTRCQQRSGVSQPATKLTLRRRIEQRSRRPFWTFLLLLRNKLRFITLRFRAFNSHFCPKRLTVFHTPAMQCADQHTRFWVQYLTQGDFDMQSRGIEPVTFQITRRWLNPWATAGPICCLGSAEL